MYITVIFNVINSYKDQLHFIHQIGSIIFINRHVKFNIIFQKSIKCFMLLNMFVLTQNLLKIILPFIERFQYKSVLAVGNMAISICRELRNDNTISLTDPFDLRQLDKLGSVDIALVSDVTEILNKPQAMEWLGVLRNYHTQHIMVISDKVNANDKDWQLTDYLSLGLKYHGDYSDRSVFSYTIEDYHFKRDWLNSKFWANPEIYDKYRW